MNLIQTISYLASTLMVAGIVGAHPKTSTSMLIETHKQLVPSSADPSWMHNTFMTAGQTVPSDQEKAPEGEASSPSLTDLQNSFNAYKKHNDAQMQANDEKMTGYKTSIDNIWDQMGTDEKKTDANTTGIGDLKDKLKGDEGYINQHRTAIDKNSANIGSLQDKLGTDETNIKTNTTNIGTNTTDISKLRSRLKGDENHTNKNIEDHESRIESLQNKLGTDETNASTTNTNVSKLQGKLKHDEYYVHQHGKSIETINGKQSSDESQFRDLKSNFELDHEELMNGKQKFVHKPWEHLDQVFGPSAQSNNTGALLKLLDKQSEVDLGDPKDLSNKINHLSLIEYREKPSSILAALSPLQTDEGLKSFTKDFKENAKVQFISVTDPKEWETNLQNIKDNISSKDTLKVEILSTKDLKLSEADYQKDMSLLNDTIRSIIEPGKEKSPDDSQPVASANGDSQAAAPAGGDSQAAAAAPTDSNSPQDPVSLVEQPPKGVDLDEATRKAQIAKMLLLQRMDIDAWHKAHGVAKIQDFKTQIEQYISENYSTLYLVHPVLMVFVTIGLSAVSTVLVLMLMVTLISASIKANPVTKN